jgi:hypothetical protein
MGRVLGTNKISQTYCKKRNQSLEKGLWQEPVACGRMPQVKVLIYGRMSLARTCGMRPPAGSHTDNHKHNDKHDGDGTPD